LQAVVPGLVLAELWQLVGSVEIAFTVIAWFVVIASLLGVITSLLTTLNERQREFAILRSLGAGPGYLFSLIISEVFFICLIAIALAISLLTAILVLFQPWLLGAWGLSISLNVISSNQLLYLVGVLMVALALSIIPAWVVYRRGLHDGLSMRI
jgi:putative ABC transport system permease protein